MLYALSWLAGFLYGQWLQLTVVAPEAYRVSFDRARGLGGTLDRQEQDVVTGIAILRHANVLAQAEDGPVARWKFVTALDMAAAFLLKAGWSEDRIKQKVALEIDIGEDE